METKATILFEPVKEKPDDPNLWIYTKRENIKDFTYTFRAMYGSENDINHLKMADRENIYAVTDIDWETDGEHIDLSRDLSFLNKWKGRLDITGYDLLHGYCNAFAKALNEEFGYRMFRVVDGYGTLVHCYACGTESGRPVYIDVRGKMPDYSTFISEFERWTTEEDSLRNTKPMNPDDVYIPRMGYSEAAYELSLRIIRAFPHRYQTNI